MMRRIRLSHTQNVSRLRDTADIREGKKRDMTGTQAFGDTIEIITKRDE